MGLMRLWGWLTTQPCEYMWHWSVSAGNNISEEIEERRSLSVISAVWTLSLRHFSFYPPGSSIFSHGNFMTREEMCVFSFAPGVKQSIGFSLYISAVVNTTNIIGFRSVLYFIVILPYYYVYAWRNLCSRCGDIMTFIPWSNKTLNMTLAIMKLNIIYGSFFLFGQDFLEVIAHCLRGTNLLLFKCLFIGLCWTATPSNLPQHKSRLLPFPSLAPVAQGSVAMAPSWVFMLCMTKGVMSVARSWITGTQRSVSPWREDGNNSEALRRSRLLMLDSINTNPCITPKFFPQINSYRCIFFFFCPVWHLHCYTVLPSS